MSLYLCGCFAHFGQEAVIIHQFLTLAYIGHFRSARYTQDIIGCDTLYWHNDIHNDMFLFSLDITSYACYTPCVSVC